MQAKGRIKQIAYGINGGFTVLIDLTEARLEELKKLEPEDLTVELKKYRQKRSLDANAYFHVLVGKIAETVGLSNTNVKNLMIGRYGQPEVVDDRNVYFTTQLEPEKAQEVPEPHMILAHTDVMKGKIFYTYLLMRGSHTYDTKEMARLIDGTIQEAKDLEIETLPPEELERMKTAWKNA